MKLTIISDSHGENRLLHESANADVFIHAGDFTAGHVHRIARQWVDHTHRLSYFRFLDTVATLPHKHKIIVPGNHDQVVEIDQAWARRQAEMRDIHLLVDEELVIDGVKFYGYPWTREFYDWFFNASDEVLQQGVNSIPTDTNVLISHGPPYDLLDVNGTGEKCGCPYLRERIDTGIFTSLKYVVFGHIHESGGRMMNHNGVYMVNAALNVHEVNLYD